MTEEWRCPNAQDGAFHVVDASKLDSEKYTYPCIHCGKQVGFELVNSGMARARGGFVNPAAVPHDGYNLGPTLKIGGKADTVVSADENDRFRLPLTPVPTIIPHDGTYAGTVIPAEMQIITVVVYGETVVKVYYDGHVEYGPGFTADSAAWLFWEAFAANALRARR